MAWHFARYVGRVVEAGKAEYLIPMIANCPQEGFGRAPAPLHGGGQSGGPMPDAMDVWRAGAPRNDATGGRADKAPRRPFGASTAANPVLGGDVHGDRA